MEKIHKDLVSIIMPAYNSENTIEGSILSVLSQTYRNFELIICDDGSTDDTLGKINRLLPHERTKVIRHKSNLGVAHTRNTALREASGQYIAFLDADDKWYPPKLEKQVKLMRASGFGMSHTSYYRTSSQNTKMSLVKSKRVVTRDNMKQCNQIGNLTGIYDRKVVGTIFQQPVGAEDFKMWCQVLKATNSIGIDEPLAEYSTHPGSLSSKKLKSLLWHHNVLKNEFELDNAHAIIFTLSQAFKAVAKRVKNDVSR